MDKASAKQSATGPKRWPLDFGKLTLGSLRRYQVSQAHNDINLKIFKYHFYQIQAKFKLKGDLKDKDALIEAVSNHFFEMKIDCNKTIKKFLQIKKDERQDDSHYLRQVYILTHAFMFRKSARNKEKLDRNQAVRQEKYQNLYVASKVKPNISQLRPNKTIDLSSAITSSKPNLA